MTTVLTDYGSNCNCCCECVLDLDLVVLGSAYNCGPASAVTAGTDCTGATPNRDTDGKYHKGETVAISAAATVTCSGSCGSVIADFDHWEIQCDGSAAYEDGSRNTTIVMGSGIGCDCTATAVYVPRSTPVVFGGFTEICEVCPVFPEAGHALYSADAPGPVLVLSPPPVDLGGGSLGYLKTCEGGPTVVTISAAPTYPARACPLPLSPPSVTADFCKLTASYIGTGDTCTGNTLCSTTPTLDVPISCFDSCTAACIVAMGWTYTITAAESCNDCTSGC